MSDTLRGVVTKIINGDTIELKISDAYTDDAERYDEVERIRIASLSDEIDSHTTELEEGAPIDEDETSGTPEEATVETGRIDSTRYYGVRNKEDLEGRILGAEVEVVVRERNRAGELVSEVNVL